MSEQAEDAPVENEDSKNNKDEVPVGKLPEVEEENEGPDKGLSLWEQFKVRAEKEEEEQRIEEEKRKKVMEELRAKAEEEEAEEEKKFQAELDRREAERKKVMADRKRKKEEDALAAASSAEKKTMSGAVTSTDRASEWSMNFDTTPESPTGTVPQAPSVGSAKRRKSDTANDGPSSIVLKFGAACSSKIVGRAGGTITKIRQTSCADVKMKKQPDYCEVSISGKRSTVQKAKQMVIEHAGEQPISSSGDTADTDSATNQVAVPKPEAPTASRADVSVAIAKPPAGSSAESKSIKGDVEMKDVAESAIDKPPTASANGQNGTAPPRERKVDVVVKIGGSACTKKAQFETLNETALLATATQLGDFAKETSCSMAIIHGAGSFGHQQAKEFGVSKGQPDGNKQMSERLGEGFAKTRLSVTTLNKHVVSALLEEGLPAVGISPCPFVKTAGKKLSGGKLPPVATDGVLGLLESRLVPVVHGDAVLDETQACAILSGDIWMVELCRELSARSAVFITDVDGVLTKPPSVPDAELIREILVDMKSGELDLGDADVGQASHDVTGGLKAKLSCAAQVLMQAPDVEAVYIVKAGSEACEQALRGETPKDGTTLRRRAC